MTEIFRSEILGVVMNQLVDEPVLPTLFLRTVNISLAFEDSFHFATPFCLYALSSLMTMRKKYGERVLITVTFPCL